MDIGRWVDDYDHMDPDYVTEPFAVWAALREHCPVVHSSRYGGFWVATRYEDIDHIAHQPATFSSCKISVPPDLLGQDITIPPINSDPPDHSKFRRPLLPAFSPSQVALWEDGTRTIANDLIDQFGDRIEIDAARDYAVQIPITVMSRMLGVSEDDRDSFATWLLGFADVETAKESFGQMLNYLYHKIAEHRQEPRNDVITFLIDTEVDGERLGDGDLLNAIFLLLAAGIDTTYSAIGATLHHLATHADDRRRLVDALDRDDSSLWSLAIEEFLRALSSVSMARYVTQDTELHGQQLRAGDMVLMPFGAANRDPRVFDDPETVMIDRKDNRHFTFGVGIHRCLGSNLARMELRVALQTFLRRIPEFEVADVTGVRYSGGPGGQIRGPITLPIRILR